MTMAITKAVEEGAQAVICASTGNTSACAAAYAARAGLVCAVLVPQGKIALGKLAQALVHGAKLLQVDGNFDDCLALARKLPIDYPVTLVNSVNPYRIEGQKTAAFEIVDALGDAPDVHCLPVGNAGNITAYWKGYREYAADGTASRTPRMCGFQAAGAAPIVSGQVVEHPETIATAIRIGNPASWTKALAARDESGGRIDAVTDREILAAYRLLARTEAVFVEPASAARVAGLLQVAEAGGLRAGPAGGLHGHRQRAQGPRLGDLRRPRAGHRPGRRRRCGGPAGPRLSGRRPTRRPRPRPGHQREPGAGVRLRRPGAVLLGRRRRRGHRRRPGGLRVRRGRGRAAHRRVAPGRPGVPGGVRRAGLDPTRAAADRPQRHPAGPGDGLLGRRRDRRRAGRLGAVPRRPRGRRRGRAAAVLGARGSSRQRRPLPARRRHPLLDDGHRCPRRAADRRPAGRPGAVRPVGDAVDPRRPRPAARRRCRTPTPRTRPAARPCSCTP